MSFTQALRIAYGPLRPQYTCPHGTSPLIDEKRQRDARALLQAFSMTFLCTEDIARDSYTMLKAKLFEKYCPRGRRGSPGKFIEKWADPVTGGELGCDENDVWIAAVALAHNLVLVTNDKMEKIRAVVGGDLVVENWTAL